MSADIDLDFADREQVLKLIKATPAHQVHQGQVRRHNSGVYVTDIPYDPVNACAAIDYETAESRGYFKIDLLNMTVYQLIRDPEHYQSMLDQKPDWQRLCTDTVWASQLVHVGNYTELLHTMQPDSIPRMAAFISIIRPGSGVTGRVRELEIFNAFKFGIPCGITAAGADQHPILASDHR